MSRTDIIKIVGVSVVLFGTIWATAMEFNHFSNTIDFFTVLWKGAAIWIPFCILGSALAARMLGGHWTSGLLVGLTVGVFTFPLSASLMNRLGRTDMVYEESVPFLGMDARVKERGGIRKDGNPEADEYHVFLGEDADPTRLIVAPDPFWLQLEQGDYVTVRWLPGRLGGKTYMGVLLNRDPS